MAFHASELDTLIGVPTELRDGAEPIAEARPATIRAPPPVEPEPRGQAGSAEPQLEELPIETVTSVLDVVAAEAVQEPATRRGRKRPVALWAVVSEYLKSSPKPKTFYTILRHAEASEYAGKNPEHALKILLGRRVGMGHIQRSDAGRYKLAQAVAP